MTTDYIGKNYIESARVYLKLEERSTIVIKCCLCTTAALTDWMHFVRHLAACHAVIGNCSQEQNLELDEEILAEVEVEQQNLKNEFHANTDTETDIETDSQFLEEEEYLNETDVDANDDQNEYLSLPNTNKHNVVDKPNQPFYSLLHTNPELVHYFIDLLHQQKYLWCGEYRNMDFKTERSESAQQISKSLSERFNVSLRPQVICLSACALIKWFNGQYAMSISKPGFCCRHQAYYEKLHEFLPTQGISILHCNECKRRFYNEDQLRRHKHRVHDGRYPYICDVCSMGFSHACKLRMHQSRTHRKTMRWQCTACKYCAPNKWDLRVHLSSHSGQRNFTCELCGITTKTSSALAVHRRTHSEHKVNCPYCPKKYRENYLLKCHVKKMHAEGVEQNAD